MGKLGSYEPIEITKEWIESMRKVAPGNPAAEPKQKRRVLMFSVSTGYMHWVIPHTAEIVKIIAKTSGAFVVEETEDPESFVPENLERFDAVIFNNNCSMDEKRDLFLDILGDEARSETLRKNIIAYVSAGGGLVSLHGGIIAFNNAEDWGEMQGGSFDNHPAQQELVLTTVDPSHPLVQAFRGKPFVHIDEPYLFKGAYDRTDFRPLLVMDKDNLIMHEGDPTPSRTCYAAWIKPYGEGRVFYCSPSHNAQSFDDPRLMQFILDGMQYAFGDIECDDSSVGNPG